MSRVWGTRADEQELSWFYERNPVRPASVLLAEVDGRVVATAGLAFLRMSIGGEDLEVGMPLRVATDIDQRGKGIFGKLAAENEERARAFGIRLLLTVPNAASAPVFLTRLGWSELHPVRVWARPRVLPRRGGGAKLFVEPHEPRRDEDRVLRDRNWLNWRFAEVPTPYSLIEGNGYAVAGRKGRMGVVAAVEGPHVRSAAAFAGGPVVIAAPPPSAQASYLRAGFVPTPKTLTVLGKSLDPMQPVPEHPHFELGDLDFL